MTLRRHPQVQTQPPEVRDRCFILADVCASLEQKKHANYGSLPQGARQEAIADLRERGITLSLSQFDQLWRKQYLPYRAAFPDSPPEEAFSPLQKGRLAGRALPPEVVTLIKQLHFEPHMRSLNYDGSLNEQGRPLTSRMILHGVWEVYPHYKERVHIHHIYAVIRDVERTERATALLARGEGDTVDDHLPTRNSGIEGVFEQVQVDIRPLPSYVRWNNLVCTTKAIVIADRLSGEILAANVIPGKCSDTNDDILSGDYTAQAVRELFAIAILKYRRRPRAIYADNGPQFRAASLQRHLRYLAAPGDEPTRLINRTASVPRGGGFIEHVLGDLDRYLQKFAGTYHEKREHYRQVLKRVKQDVNALPTFEAFAKDFQAHVTYLNTTRDDAPDGQSRVDRRKQGPDYSLPPPSAYNLVVFARLLERKTVRIQRYGFRYNNNQWEPEQDTPEVRAQWLQAALSTTTREDSRRHV